MKLAIALTLLAALACFGFTMAKKVESQSNKEAMAELESILKSGEMSKRISKEDNGEDDSDSKLLSQDDDDSMVQSSKLKHKVLDHLGSVKAASYGAIQRHAASQGYWFNIPYWMWKHFWPFYYYGYYRFRVLRLMHHGY